MNQPESSIAYLGPEWRGADVAEEPIPLDPASGYARWLEATGRGEGGNPHYGLSRSFPGWSPIVACARPVTPRGSARRRLPFEPIALAIDASGIGQVPSTVPQLEALARSRRGCFLSAEVAAGAAFDAFLRGLVPDGGAVDVLVSDVDLGAREVVEAAEERRHLGLWRWAFRPAGPGSASPEAILHDAIADKTGSHLFGSERGSPLPDLVILPL